MNLSEFLLARIAEDEAAAKEDEPDGTVEGTELHWQTLYLEDRALTIDPARVLAECEAKRRMVTYARSLMGPSEERPDLGELWSDHDIARDFVGLLALPYADHPDYQEDWRP